MDGIANGSATSSGLYLKINSPINCNGTVTAWHFCYHSQAKKTNMDYVAQFAVYRPVEHGYARLDGSCVTVMREIAGGELLCGTLPVKPDQQVVVSTGDVIGVCLSTNSRTHQLRVASKTEDGGVAGAFHGTVGYVPSACFCAMTGTYDTSVITLQKNLRVHITVDVGEFICYNNM